MRKLILTSAISAITTTMMAAPVMAASMTCSVGTGTNNGLVYTTSATSNGISVSASATTNVYYVNTTSTASHTSNPAGSALVVTGDWCIDTTTGEFEGNIAYGDYKTQTNVTSFPVIDGRQTFAGVNQHFEGTGTWNNVPAQPTFNFTIATGSSNSGIASTQTQTSSSCANGKTSIFGKVCNAFATATPDWEGLIVSLVFNDSTKYSFVGTVTGIDTSGSGIATNTTTINWNVAGIDPPAVPVPAAAWLFGSGLIGLAGAARRRSRK